MDSIRDFEVRAKVQNELCSVIRSEDFKAEG